MILQHFLMRYKMSFMFRGRKEIDFDYGSEFSAMEVINMRSFITYGVDVSWSELVGFLDERYLDLLCRRLNVSREDISRVPFFLDSEGGVLCFFNRVKVDK